MAASSSRSVRIVRSVSSDAGRVRRESCSLPFPHGPAEAQERLSLSWRRQLDAMSGPDPIGEVVQVFGQPASFREAQLAAQRLLQILGRGNGGGRFEAASECADRFPKSAAGAVAPPVFQEELDLPHALLIDGHRGGEGRADGQRDQEPDDAPGENARGDVAATSAIARGHFDCGRRAAVGRSARDEDPRPGSRNRRSDRRPWLPGISSGCPGGPRSRPRPATPLRDGSASSRA